MCTHTHKTDKTERRTNGYYNIQFTNSHVAALNQISASANTPQTPIENESSSSEDEDDINRYKKPEGEIRSLSQYFLYSEEEAANKLNISKSKLKRIKKRLNITRWPYRRVM
jgi:hypothetical protein